MPEVALLDRAESRLEGPRQDQALSLARRFPSLVVAAREVAASVLHGVHGRRRAGLGETFWQFRPFVAGKSTSRIDWRRSARDERLYVREREWEAAHTVMLWIDRSASMYFSSKLALQPKIDRALVLGLAAADLLIRGGERVGLLGLTRPLAARNIVERFGEVLLAEERGDGLRPGRARAFGQPAAQFAGRADRRPAQRSQRHRRHDRFDQPARRARPSHHGRRSGRGDLSLRRPCRIHRRRFAGAASRRRRGVRSAPIMCEGSTAHRDSIRAAARARGWTLMLHRTDRPASEALLALRMQLEANSTNAAAGLAL